MPRPAPLPEPPDGSTVLICNPVTGLPEDAWHRDDHIAAMTGYGAQHWYPLGRFKDDPPETWLFLTADRFKDDRFKVVTATKTIR